MISDEDFLREFKITEDYLRERLKAELKVMEGPVTSSDRYFISFGKEKFPNKSNKEVKLLLNAAFGWDIGDTTPFINLLDAYKEKDKFLKRAQAAYRKKLSRRYRKILGTAGKSIEISSSSSEIIKGWALEQGVTMSQVVENLIANEQSKILEEKSSCDHVTFSEGDS